MYAVKISISDDRRTIHLNCPDLNILTEMPYDAKGNYEAIVIHLNKIIATYGNRYIIPLPRPFEAHRAADLSDDLECWTLLPLQKPRQREVCSIILPAAAFINALISLCFEVTITIISLQLTVGNRGETSNNTGKGLGISAAAFNIFTTLSLFYLAGALNIPRNIGRTMDNLLQRRVKIPAIATAEQPLIVLKSAPSLVIGAAKYGTIISILIYNVIRGIMLYQEVYSLQDRVDSETSLIGPDRISAIAKGYSFVQTLNNTLFMLSFVTILLEKINQYYIRRNSASFFKKRASHMANSEISINEKSTLVRKS